jgi:hypothetical protein
MSEKANVMEPRPEAVFVVSAAITVILIALVWLVPAAARRLTATGFLVAGAVNLWTAFTNPAIYVQAFGPHALAGWREFIYGPFAAEPALFIFLIAALQILIAVLALNNSPFGPLGAMIFLLAITPLGVAAGFPSPPVLAAAMFWLWRRTPREPITGPLSRLEDVVLRLAGLALAIFCCLAAIRARFPQPWETVFLWAVPLLTIPISFVGRKAARG